MNDYSHIWSLPEVVKYFDKQRNNFDKLYEGEKFFLDKILNKQMSVLDIGCAQGGLYKILKKKYFIKDYLGIDISRNMIEEAKKKYKENLFVHYDGCKYFNKLKKKYDVVIVFGILHLNKNWQEILINAYKVSKKFLIFDLRETHLNSIQSIKKSYMDMSFSSKNIIYKKSKLPYNIVNLSETRIFMEKYFKNNQIYCFSKKNIMTKAASLKNKKLLMNTYCVIK